MAICKNCGVELEADMQYCPLCGQAVNDDDTTRASSFYSQYPAAYSNRIRATRNKFTWEIVSLILACAILATFLVDFIINRRITWSEYPVAISLVIFCYISVLHSGRERPFINWHLV